MTVQKVNPATGKPFVVGEVGFIQEPMNPQFPNGSVPNAVNTARLNELSALESAKLLTPAQSAELATLRAAPTVLTPVQHKRLADLQIKAKTQKLDGNEQVELAGLTNFGKTVIPGPAGHYPDRF